MFVFKNILNLTVTTQNLIVLILRSSTRTIGTIQFCDVMAFLVVILGDKLQNLMRPRPLARSCATGCLDLCLAHSIIYNVQGTYNWHPCNLNVCLSTVNKMPNNAGITVQFSIVFIVLVDNLNNSTIKLCGVSALFAIFLEGKQT